MQVILHAGAHGTEEDRLMKSLLANAEAFQQIGIAVPEATTYRILLKQQISQLEELPPPSDGGKALWQNILGPMQPDRVILSNAHVFGAPREALDSHRLYPEADDRMLALRQVFPNDPFHLFLGLRDPGTWLPVLLQNATPQRQEMVLKNCNVQLLRWSELLIRLRNALPDMPITVWCHEDMPLIWGNIIRRMADLDTDQKIRGGMDLLHSIMSGEGMKRLRSYLHAHKNMDDTHKQRVFAAFLDKYALDEAIEEEIDLPGWSDALMDRMSEIYEDDVERIERIEGVTLITPSIDI